jgi:anti-sigma B factor antagonist
MTVTMTPIADDPCRFLIEGEMTIYTAQELKDQLLAQLQQGQALVLDLTRVSELDSAGVQLLVLLRNEAAASNKRFELHACSPAVLDVLTLCQLTGWLAMPAQDDLKEKTA